VSQRTNPRPPIEQAYRVALGRRVRQLRLEKNLSQEELADRAGMNRTHPGMIENAKVDVQFSTLVRIALVLEITLSHFLDFEVNVNEAS
jgi:transcriptional regulator with XRE-family HTH domain